jgi:hypothetical protein
VTSSQTTRCAWCGRFVGEDSIELQDADRATPDDPDGWTDQYVCPDHFAPETTYAEDPLGGAW